MLYWNRASRNSEKKNKGKANLVDIKTIEVAILFPKIQCDACGSKRKACEIR